MQSPGPISDDPPHKGVLREETVILRWILGYGPTTQLSGAPWPRVPPTISPPRSNSNIRRVGFVSIDIDELKEDERGIQSFHLGVSTVEAQGLQNLLFSQPGSEVNLASHVIKSRHYVVADPRYCGKKRNKFLFGKRNQIGLMDVEKKLKNSLHVPNSILIFHGGKRELAVLKQLNIMLDPLFTIDTVKAAQHPLELFYRYSLRKLLREFGIPYALLHFAGNDAHFVLRALLMIAVRDAERELDRMPDWVSVFRAVAQAPRPPTLDEKAMIAKRERLEREEREREKEKGKESHGPGVKDSEPDGPRVTEEAKDGLDSLYL